MLKEEELAFLKAIAAFRHAPALLQELKEGHGRQSQQTDGSRQLATPNGQEEGEPPGSRFLGGAGHSTSGGLSRVCGRAGLSASHGRRNRPPGPTEVGPVYATVIAGHAITNLMCV